MFISITKTFSIMVKPIVEKRSNVDFNEALTLTGFGKFNIFLLLASGGCIFSVILETSGMMFVSPAAECDLNLTLTTKGYLASASFLGVVLGSHFWGFIADTRGRKKSIVISMLGSFLITLISSLAAWDWLFILLRFLNGLVISAASSVAYAYCGEFHNDISRPKMVSGVATFAGIANALISAIAWLILPYEWAYDIPFLDITFRPWRLLVLAYGLPSIVFGVCILCIPESPKFLLTLGERDKAMDILRTMFKVNSGQAMDKFPVSNITWNDQEEPLGAKNVSLLKSMWEQTLCLISKPLALKTLMVCVLQFGAFGMVSGLMMWYPTVINQMVVYEEENPNQEITLCKAIQYNLHLQEQSNDFLVETNNCNDLIYTEVYLVLIFSGAVMVVAYIAIGRSINFIGAKNILIGLLVVSAIAGLIAQYISGSITVKFFMGLTVISTSTVGVITAIVVDMYSTKVRAMALAISLMCGRIGAFVVSHVQGIIFYEVCNYTFPIFAAVNIVLIIIAILLPTSRTRSKSKTTENVT